VLLGLERRTKRLDGHREHLRNLGYEGQLDDDQLARRVALCEGIHERTSVSSENQFADIRRTHFLRSLEAEPPANGQRGRIVGWLGKRAVDPDGSNSSDKDGRPCLSVRFLFLIFCRVRCLWISESQAAMRHAAWREANVVRTTISSLTFELCPSLTPMNSV
jgi:hypothetical protein